MIRASLLVLASQVLPAQEAWDAARVERAFQGMPYLLLVQEGDRVVQRGTLDPEEALSPCSTFKLPHALIGLERGVILPGSDARLCDPKECHADHGRLGLTDAIRQSCVSYFRQVARKLGPRAEEEGLHTLGYAFVGDLQPLDGFWLRPSGLRVTARQQLTWIRRFYSEGLPVSKAPLDVVRAATRRTETAEWTLWGKTGSSGPADGVVHGWFTGQVEWKDGHASHLVVLIKGKGQRYMGLEAQARLERLLKK